MFMKIILAIVTSLLLQAASCSTRTVQQEKITDPKQTYLIRYESLKDSYISIEQLINQSNGFDNTSVAEYLSEVISDVNVMMECVTPEIRKDIGEITDKLKVYRDQLNNNSFTTATVQNLSYALNEIKENYPPDKVSYIIEKNTAQIHKDNGPGTRHTGTISKGDEWIYISGIKFYLEQIINSTTPSEKRAEYDTKIQKLFELLLKSTNDEKLSNYSNWYKSLSSSTEQFKKLNKDAEETITQLKGISKVLDEYAQ